MMCNDVYADCTFSSMVIVDGECASTNSLDSYLQHDAEKLAYVNLKRCYPSATSKTAMTLLWGVNLTTLVLNESDA